MNAAPSASDKGFQSEHLAAGGEEHLLHVFAANSETASDNAGDDLETRGHIGRGRGAHLPEVLDARDLVARRAVVLGDLGSLNRCWARP